MPVDQLDLLDISVTDVLLMSLSIAVDRDTVYSMFLTQIKCMYMYICICSIPKDPSGTVHVHVSL